VLACAGDSDGNGTVDATDLANVLSNWGFGGMTDFDRSGSTDASDLSILLDAWGPCK
jgi:hypothetical protein